MKPKRPLILVALILVAAFGGYLIGRLFDNDSTMATGDPDESTSAREVLYWQAPMNPTEIYDGPGKSAMGMDLVPVYADEADGQQQSANSTERKVLYWQAPMNPTEIYDQPGKSAMGMDLVPVYEDAASSSTGGIVSIDPATVQNMGIRTENVRREDFNRIIRTVGEVQYDEEKLYLVNAKISGWIEKLHINYVGAEVQAGDPLLEIYSPELVTTQEEYLLAVRNHEKISETNNPVAHADAEKLLESARKRLEYWDIPESAIIRLEETGEVRKTILLLARDTGIVVKKNAVEGAFINAGMDLFEIADLRTVWVHASFYDNEVPWIRQGQSAEMELSYLPGKTYTGRVSYIYPFLREKARDVHVRLIFSNPNLDLKPGMYANIRLTGRTIPDALIIPSEAVIRSGERTIAFVDHGEGRFEPREIQIGEVGGDGNAEIRVLSGLIQGESIVTSAQFMLDSESRLQEAIQKMLATRRQASNVHIQDSAAPSSTPDERLENVDHSDMAGMDHSVAPDSMKEMNHDDMQGMDHSVAPDSMKGMNHDDMQGMDHSVAPDSMKGMNHDAHSDSARISQERRLETPVRVNYITPF